MYFYIHIFTLNQKRVRLIAFETWTYQYLNSWSWKLIRVLGSLHDLMRDRHDFALYLIGLRALQNSTLLLLECSICLKCIEGTNDSCFVMQRLTYHEYMACLKQGDLFNFGCLSYLLSSWYNYGLCIKLNDQWYWSRVYHNLSFFCISLSCWNPTIVIVLPLIAKTFPRRTI